MKLPQRLRDELKIPLGVLVPDMQADALTIRAHIADAAYIITVGDKTTQKLVEFGIIPDLQIIDNLEKRLPRDAPPLPTGTIEMSCDNAAAEITEQSIEKIKKAFSLQRPVRLTVRGEEDLLVIPVCIHAPKNSIVLYGQPNEGIVIAHIDEGIRHKTQRLYDLMNLGE